MARLMTKRFWNILQFYLLQNDYIYGNFNSSDFDDPTLFAINNNKFTYNDNFVEFVSAILLQSKANKVFDA